MDIKTFRRATPSSVGRSGKIGHSAFLLNNFSLDVLWQHAFFATRAYWTPKWRANRSSARVTAGNPLWGAKAARVGQSPYMSTTMPVPVQPGYYCYARTSLTNCHGQKGFAKWKRKGRSTKLCLRFFSFFPQDLVMIFQSLEIILPQFFDFERPL